MGRAPCCEKDSVKRGPWTPEEDAKLLACISQHGTGSWRTLPKKAGLQRCGKSCRLRWTNYLRPDLKHGRFSDQEEQMIVKLHAALGSRWSLIAAQLPGRTDNDVKNYWNTRLKKKLCEMGIDPITHKPISQLLADLAGSIALPKGNDIAEATLGCFKDDMLNVLMRKRPAPDHQHIFQTSAASTASSSLQAGFPSQHPWDLVNPSSSNSRSDGIFNHDLNQRGCSSSVGNVQTDAFAQKLKTDLSRSTFQSPKPSQPVSYMNGVPSGPATGLRTQSGVLSRSMVAIPPGAQQFARQGSFSSGYPHLSSEEFAFNEEYLSKSMMEMLLESNRMAAASDLSLIYGKEISNLNMEKSRRSAGAPSLREIPCTDAALTIPSQTRHYTNPSQHSLPEHQYYMALLHQQDGSFQSKPNQSATMGQNSRSETVAWSPSCTSRSSSSSNLPAAEASGLDGVLSSDALLWDFSELGSMI